LAAWNSWQKKLFYLAFPAEVVRRVWYNGTKIFAGVIKMAGLLAALFVCAYVFVIKENLLNVSEEEAEYY
jgi:hypothetical protein